MVADAVAGVGGVGVGGVFLPGLVGAAEVGFDVGAAGLEEGAEDFSGALVGMVDGDDGVDGAEAFGPGSAEELHEDGFGLVVEGVGGEDGVGVAGGDEGVEEVVADGAGGFFDGFAGVWATRCGDVGVVDVEGDVEAGAEGLDEVRSAADSSAGRMPWSTWAAERPTPRESRWRELAAWRVRRRATESAPPEMAAQMRSPGWMWVRSKARVDGGWHA